MIKFNPATAVEAAMDIRDQKEADQYLQDYIKFNMKSNSNINLKEAGVIARQNIGYYAGYFDHEVGYRMEELFGAIHPILGSMEVRTKLTSQQIFNLGVAYATKHK